MAKKFCSIFSQKGGFFVEAGAYDGEALSNSLHFEANSNWEGLLIEPNPDLFGTLLTKNRKANLFGYCLSTKTTPEVVLFDAAGVFGGIIHNDKKPGDGFSIKDPNHEFYYKRQTLEIQCFPLYTILLALDRTTVHLLSLDIEGAELEVLRSIPFDKVDIKVIVVEVKHVNKVFNDADIEQDIDKLLARNGFNLFAKVHINNVYVKEDFKLKRLKSQFKPFLVKK